MTGPRYAIYFAPGKVDALTKKGESWLGYSAWSKKDSAPPETELAGSEWDEFTSTPRGYGFHATLKAPMRLKEGIEETQFLGAVERYASSARPAVIENAIVGAIGPFLAIIPQTQSAEVTEFAGDVVKAFEEFRAPLRPEEVEKRKKNGLTARQQTYLEHYGYPYIFDDFRFHMTLTGALPENRQDHVKEIATAYFSDLLPGRLAINRLVIFKQDEAGARFHIIAEFPL